MQQFGRRGVQTRKDLSMLNADKELVEREKSRYKEKGQLDKF